jgi:copper resistance protein D
MFPWFHLSLFIHLLAVITFVGGMAFLAMILVPALREPDLKNSAGPVMRAAARRFGKIGAASVLILIVTGFTNAFAKGYGAVFFSSEFWKLPYAHLFGTKFVLALAIIAVSMMHIGRRGNRALDAMNSEPAAEMTARLQRSSARSGRINMVLALIAVVLGILMSRSF